MTVFELLASQSETCRQLQDIAAQDEQVRGQLFADVRNVFEATTYRSKENRMHDLTQILPAIQEEGNRCLEFFET